LSFLNNDSDTFSLEANKYYFLKVSVSEKINPDTNLCSLSLNGEPILLLSQILGKGDHLYPFFTGVKALNAKITGGESTLISKYPWQVYFISGIIDVADR